MSNVIILRHSGIKLFLCFIKMDDDDDDTSSVSRINY